MVYVEVVMIRVNRQHWPYMITASPQCIQQQETWLEQNVGLIQQDWMVIAFTLHSVDYYFRRERDAVNFALRWS